MFLLFCCVWKDPDYFLGSDNIYRCGREGAKVVLYYEGYKVWSRTTRRAKLLKIACRTWQAGNHFWDKDLHCFTPRNVSKPPTPERVKSKAWRIFWYAPTGSDPVPILLHRFFWNIGYWGKLHILFSTIWCDLFLETRIEALTISIKYDRIHRQNISQISDLGNVLNICRRGDSKMWW